jgi:hypothetical protein
MRLFKPKYLCFFLLLWAGCKADKKNKQVFKSPAGYDFQNPQKIKLGEDLDEISGIVYDQSDGSLVALNDEEGKLYRVFTDGRPPSTGNRFHKGGDYEDLCFDGKNWFALKSNGNISHIYNPFTDSVRSEEYKFPIKGNTDFETIFPDPKNNRLIILCKQCNAPGDKVPGYSFTLASGETDSVPAFYLDMSLLTENPLPGKETLKPSAAAFHPLTGDLFVLASANGLLIISDAEGKAREAYKLDKKIFKQPEGICFSPGGDLFISNEARNGMANIQHFTYSGAKKK